MGIKTKNENIGRQAFEDQEIKEAFKAFDLDRNGYIGAAEIRFVLDHMNEDVTDEEIDEMVNMLDYEGKGQVNFRNFYEMATGIILPPPGMELPDPFEDDDALDGPMGEDLDFLAAAAEKEINKIKEGGKKKVSSSGLSSDLTSSEEEDSIMMKKKKFKKMGVLGVLA